MPLNGSGAYTPPSPQFPAIANTLILASDYNAVINDISNALSQAVFRDGQGAFTGNQSMGGFKLTNMAVGTADTDSVRKSQLLALFPVGAIYLTAGNTNPGTFLGGTWAQIAQGRTLIGVGTLGSDTYAAGATGGAARVTLSTSEIPSHNHPLGGSTAANGGHNHTLTDPGHYHSRASGSGGATAYASWTSTTGSPDGVALTGPSLSNISIASVGDHSHTLPTATQYEGGGGAHENRMPYIAVYFWQRTA